MMRNCHRLHSASHANTPEESTRDEEIQDVEDDAMVQVRRRRRRSSSSRHSIRDRCFASSSSNYYCHPSSHLFFFYGRLLLVLWLPGCVSIDSIMRDGQVNQYGMRIIAVVLNRNELLYTYYRYATRGEWS